MNHCVRFELGGPDTSTSRTIAGFDGLLANSPLRVLEGNSVSVEGFDLPSQHQPSSVPRVLSLGALVALANDFTEKHPVYLIHNFSSPPDNFGIPVQVDAQPVGTNALSLLPIACLRENEKAITIPTDPNLIRYFCDRGLLVSPEQVIMCDTNGGSQDAGYPHFDPLHLLTLSDQQIEPGYAVSVFTNRQVRSDMRANGLTPVQRSDSFYTNDKARFRADAEQFGYRMANGLTLESMEDIARGVRAYEGQKTWIKLSHGLGGDLVIPIAETSTRDIVAAIRKIRDEVQKATNLNDVPDFCMDRVWPEDQLLPNKYKIVMEQDVGYHGTVVSTASNLMEVRRDGNFEVKGHFQQIISPNGEFLGSESFNVTEQFGVSFTEDLYQNYQAIAEHCRKLKLFGLVGIDFMVVENPKGEFTPFIIELNGRPPVSAIPEVVANKLGVKKWISPVVQPGISIATFDDLETLLESQGMNLLHSDPNQGAIIPLYLSTIYAKSGNRFEILHPTTTMQILVTGRDKEQCKGILEDLIAKGVFTI